MDEDFKIKQVKGLLALDSRGNPTVKAIVKTERGIGVGISPSGASKSSKEAVELRDGGKKWNGMGTSIALSKLNEVIAPRLVGIDSRKQAEADILLVALDGTSNKSSLGGNTTTAVSIATSKAAASTAGLELFEYLGGVGSKVLPTPILNVINGGVHAGNNLSFQEHILIPAGAGSFSEAIRMAVEVYKNLKEVIKEKYGKNSVNVGDEGGYAPPMNSSREAFEAISAAIKKAGYSLGSEFFIGIDPAASEFYDKEKRKYIVEGKEMATADLLEYYKELVDEFSIIYLEDPFDEDDFEAFKEITKELSKKVLIVGDDLYATNVTYLRQGIEARATNAALVKVNQVGTVTETLNYVRVAKEAGMRPVVSHRSGDTEDPFIADLAVAIGSGIIKTGAPARSERVSKYNRLLEIESLLGPSAMFLGKEPFLRSM
ncbi:MAG: phosphopyruvate hydratase [Caldisphaeraceae archaeon]|nr:phosphopyruvate hydratase [Caldisphaeraceae archaeon]